MTDDTMLAPDSSFSEAANSAKSVASMTLPIADEDSMLPRNDQHVTLRTSNDNATKVCAFSSQHPSCGSGVGSGFSRWVMNWATAHSNEAS